MGRVPRLPSELLSDESNVLTYENVKRPVEGLQMADFYRLDALRAFIDEEQQGALAIGIKAKTVQRKEGFETGQKVAYWVYKVPRDPVGSEHAELATSLAPLPAMSWIPSVLTTTATAVGS